MVRFADKNGESDHILLMGFSDTSHGYNSTIKAVSKGCQLQKAEQEENETFGWGKQHEGICSYRC